MNVDDALAAWADSMRLPDQVAHDVRYRIMTDDIMTHDIVTHDEPEDWAEPRFWRRFNADLAATMKRSTRTAA